MVSAGVTVPPLVLTYPTSIAITIGVPLREDGDGPRAQPKDETRTGGGRSPPTRRGLAWPPTHVVALVGFSRATRSINQGIRVGIRGCLWDPCTRSRVGNADDGTGGLKGEPTCRTRPVVTALRLITPGASSGTGVCETVALSWAAACTANSFTHLKALRSTGCKIAKS